MIEFKCAYCSDPKTHFVRLNTTEEYNGIEIAINGPAQILRVRTYYDAMDTAHGFQPTQDIIHINYCPMCGRKL